MSRGLGDVYKRQDYEPSKIDLNSDSFFYCRFSNFRTDLQELIARKVLCNPISLKFGNTIDKSFFAVADCPFTRYTILETEEIVTGPSSTNPIRVLRFNSGAINFPVPSVVGATPASKKTIVKKLPESKSSAFVVDAASSSPSLSDCSNTFSSPTKPFNDISETKVISIQPSSKPNIVSNVSIAGNLNYCTISKATSPNRDADSSISSSDNQIPNNYVYNRSHSLANIRSSTSVDPLGDATKSPSALDSAAVIAPANINTFSHGPKSALYVDWDSFEDLRVESGQVSPIFSKRLSSSVPVPIEIFSSEELAVTPPVPGSADTVMSLTKDDQLGCTHYKINCKFYAECCGKWFPCRFCHDLSSDHKLNRHETRFCLCMFCGTSQKASVKCCNPKCLSVLAHYYCDSCKFWDNDATKSIFHGEKCGICRTGLKQNHTHCARCGQCGSNSIISNHNCSIDPVVFDAQNNNIQHSSASDKRPKLGLSKSISSSLSQSQPTTQSWVSFSGIIKTSVVHAHYVNFLKKRLAFWRNK